MVARADVTIDELGLSLWELPSGLVSNLAARSTQELDDLAHRWSLEPCERWLRGSADLDPTRFPPLRDVLRDLRELSHAALKERDRIFVGETCP